MMATGVAHEINNPMSFVTSNIHSLYRELKEHPSLPEPFQEYVDDVLPATLDGIRRVTAIVSELRRFACGDAETYVEFDLNAEVQAALRIAHNQLRHCQVETDLDEVGQFTGRPQQIAQAVVNVLVNAGQATASGGQVHLSTRSEGGWVRVAVNDTGTGIPPEAMRNLFQPFFTTKPQGAGMGLGLACRTASSPPMAAASRWRRHSGRAPASPCICRASRASPSAPAPCWSLPRSPLSRRPEP
jgi:two-component system NtrC family sensor kinase